MLIGEQLRRGDCGVWHRASDVEGIVRGALRVDAELLASHGALRRLVAIVAQVRTANVPGVLPVLDLIEQPAGAGDAIWLITALPPERTLADLAPGDQAADAVRRVGQTLLALHAVGIAHGALSTSTVVLGPAGQVLLAEVGMRAAMAGTSADVAADELGYARLAGSPSAPDEPEAGTDRTMLGRRGSAGARPAAPAAPPPASAAIRFGPGVPGAASSGAATGAGGLVRRSRRRRGRWVSAVVTLAVVAGAAFWWWHRLGGLAVESASVRSYSSAAGCAGTVDVVGVVTTNGRRGVLHYRWLRNDGQATGELAQTIAGGQRSVTLHLAWTFAGHGDFAAVATLEVLSPDPTSALGRFRYRCT